MRNWWQSEATPIKSLVSCVFHVSLGEKLSLRFKYVFFIKCYQSNLKSIVCRSSIEKSIHEERLYWGNRALLSKFYWFSGLMVSSSHGPNSLTCAYIHILCPETAFPLSEKTESISLKSGLVLLIALVNRMQQKQEYAISELLRRHDVFHLFTNESNAF